MGLLLPILRCIKRLALPPCISSLEVSIGEQIPM
jgi:hypothetical protein